MVGWMSSSGVRRRRRRAGAHANLADAWAQNAMVSAGRGRDFCAEAAAALTEAMALGEADHLASTAARLTEPQHGQLPPACAAATRQPAD